MTSEGLTTDSPTPKDGVQEGTSGITALNPTTCTEVRQPDPGHLGMPLATVFMLKGAQEIHEEYRRLFYGCSYMFHLSGDDSRDRYIKGS